jgi:hypothetical protein
MEGEAGLAGLRFVACATLFLWLAVAVPPPGSRVVVDAHNCYPYNGKWADRIDRALSTGVPVAIEQDLFWYTDPKTGRSWSLVSHGDPVDGTEPLMRDYFFERIRPIMEKALRDGNSGDWPLITLNLDFKSDEPEHHAAVWKLLGEYEGWLTTAERGPDPRRVMPLKPGPLLVLTGEADSQERDFHDIVPVGSRLRAFGAIHTYGRSAHTPPPKLAPGQATNYRRWWNNPWSVVEEGGQRHAGAWSRAGVERLRSLVKSAHARGLWIRFYTLNGTAPGSAEKNGWDTDYDFGSRERVQARWSAAIRAGVDYIATDQYEDLAAFKRTVEEPKPVRQNR